MNNLSGKKKVVKKKIGAERTKYFTGKLLTPDDFEDEQEYYLSKKKGTKKVGKAKKKKS